MNNSIEHTQKQHHRIKLLAKILTPYNSEGKPEQKSKHRRFGMNNQEL